MKLKVNIIYCLCSITIFFYISRCCSGLVKQKSVNLLLIHIESVVIEQKDKLTVLFELKSQTVN